MVLVLVFGGRSVRTPFEMSKAVAKSNAKAREALRKANPGTGAGGAPSTSTTRADRSSPFYEADEILPYLTEEESAALRQEALNTINGELVHPEDLEVAVPRLLRSCVTELKELRRSVSTMSSSQIAEAQRALQIVVESAKQVEDLRESFMKQGRLIQGLGAETKAYTQLRQLHILRDNVGAVIKWSLALKEVRYDNLFALVSQRRFGSLYERLRRLQRIRQTVIAKAGAQYRSYQAIFEPYFAKLDAVLSSFVGEIYTVLMEDTMSVSILKALDDSPDTGGANGPDEDPFPEFTALKECIAVCGEEMEAPILGVGDAGREQEPPIREDLVHAAVAKSVGKYWEDEVMIDVVDPVGQLSMYLEQMKKVEPLLEALEMTLIPLSTRLSLFGVVVQAIHAEVTHVMEAYADPDADIEANGLMEASQFIQWYREMVCRNNYSKYVDVSSIDDLSAALMTAAVGGLTAHLTRLCTTCAITVCNDPNGPTILPSGYPVTTGPMDVFAVLQQTLSGLTAAVDTGVMRQIGKACAEAVYAYLKECRERIDFDLWEEENASLPTPQAANDWQQRRVMLLYAFVNDCATVESNLDTVELRFASCWECAVVDGGGDESRPGAPPHDGGGGNGLSPFQRVQDALPDNVLFYLDEIVAHVERVVGDQWAAVFRAGLWYEDDNNPVLLIVNTISEYIEEEFSVMLQEHRLRKVVRQMLVRYVQRYISTLLEFLGDVIRKPKKNAVDNWNAFIDCMARDITISVNMWSQHCVEGQGQLLDLARKAMELMKDLLAVKKPVDFAYILQEKLLDDFGDCPTFVISFALEARQREVDQDTRERMKTIWEERTAYQRRDKGTDLPTAGWSQGPSFYGSIDRSIADLEHQRGIFRKSAKKKRDEEMARKAAQEKETKRAARRARQEADAAAAAAARMRGPTRVLKASPQSVEVSSLADVLK